MSDLFGSSSEDERPLSPPSQERSGGDGDEERALFGSEDEEEFDERAEAPPRVRPEEPQKGGGESDGLRSQREGLDDLFGSDDEVGAERRTKNEPRVKTTSELCLPDLEKTLPHGTLAIATTMPSYLRIQTTAYVNSEHDSVQERKALEGAIDVIRYRTKLDADGNPVRDSHGNIVKESNARMVKWSDGSYQLLVGDEVFDATLLPLYHSFTYARQRNEEPSDSSSQPHPPPSSCLRSVGAVPQKMKLFPHSVHSEAHARMSAKVTDKYVAATKLSIKHHDTLSQDPEQEAQARIEEENARLREERKRRATEGFTGSGSKRRPSSGMNAQFLEEEERGDYDLTSLSALKKGRVPQGKGAFGRRRNVDSEGEEEEDEEADERDGEMDDFIVNDEASDEDDDEEGEYVDEDEEEDDDGDDIAGSRQGSGSEASNSKGRKNAVGKSRIKRRGAGSEDMELDEDGEESEESFRDSSEEGSSSGGSEEEEEEEGDDDSEARGGDKEVPAKRPPAPSRPMRKIVDSDDD